MTQAMWIFIILCFLLPAATDLLFHNVSVCWLIGCTVIAMIISRDDSVAFGAF